MQVKLSVIVPVYNVEKYLRVCVDSILNQTLTSLELLLIDDGSTDASGIICDEYAQKDQRIRVYHIPNGGPANARNTALRLAVGKYIGFVDSDDWIDPEMYQTLCAKADEVGAQLCFCDYVAETSKGSLYEKSYNFEQEVFDRENIETKFLPYFFGYRDDELANYKAYCPFADYHSYNVLGVFKTALLREHDILFKSEGTYFNEDNLLNLDVILHATVIAHVSQYFYHYRYNDSSISMSFHARYAEMKMEKFQYLREYIRLHDLSGNYNRRLDNKIGIEAVSLVNYYAGSNLSVRDKYRYVSHIAKSPVIAPTIARIKLKHLKISKVKVFLFLLKMRLYATIVLLSSLYGALIKRL